VSSPTLPYSQWCPPELTAAAKPLLATGSLLKALADDRRGLERFADSVPSEAVRAAFAAFVERWELVIWDASGTAHSLGQNLQWAAEDYERSEAGIARRLQLDNSDDDESRRR
jgi:hypothetical protein